MDNIENQLTEEEKKRAIAYEEYNEDYCKYLNSFIEFTNKYHSSILGFQITRYESSWSIAPVLDGVLFP